MYSNRNVVVIAIIGILAISSFGYLAWIQTRQQVNSAEIVEIKSQIRLQLSACQDQLSSLQDVITFLDALPDDCTQKSQEIEDNLTILEMALSQLQKLLNAMEDNIDKLP